MKVRITIGGNYPELSGWALHGPKDANDAGLDNGGWGHEAREWAASRSLKGKETDSSLEPLEGTQPCQLTDCSGRLIFAFCPTCPTHEMINLYCLGDESGAPWEGVDGVATEAGGSQTSVSMEYRRFRCKGETDSWDEA